MNAHEVEALRWFRQAQADLEVVRVLRGAGHYAAACFQAQQSAEKVLKAVLFSQGQRIVWGHSVRHLAEQCQSYEPSFAALAECSALLDQFYIPTRYPNGLPAPGIPSESYTAAQAEAAEAGVKLVIGTAEEFLRFHTSVLSSKPDE